MNERQKPRILAIVGPTAVGKTALAISLAKELGGEILSCDSMQIYRGMDIGTAKPTKDEQAAAPHHLIDLVSPKTPYSCFSYLKGAKEVVDALLARSVLPIFCVAAEAAGRYRYSADPFYDESPERPER